MCLKSQIINKLIDEKRLIIDFKDGLVSFVKNGIKKIKYFWFDKDGYKMYQLRYNGQKFNIRGQKLIWFAAGGKIPKNHDIDHKDRNRANNGLLNLRCLHRSINRGKKI